jgi:subtilisin family serine protease
MPVSRTGIRPALTALRAAALAGLGAAALLAGTAAPGSATPAEGTVHRVAGAQAVTGSYVVVLKASSGATPTTYRSRTDTLAADYGATVRFRYTSAVQGFSARMSETQARRLAANPAVARVEQDSVVRLAATQNNPTWGLDRVDERTLPLDGRYLYNRTGAGVSVYMIDTGLRPTHTQFGNRARVGTDTTGGLLRAGDGQDCNGHGTHVAGTIGGSTYGIAKAVKLIGVRVLDCSGSGTTSGVIAGVDWVKAHAVKPAVANMSLGGPASSTLDNAVISAIRSGITFVLAAGNESQAACNVSPARVTSAITVGATTSADGRASYSNYGSCLDLFAPGSDITSAWYSSNTATNTISGTSMAAPHVAGAAALYLSARPSVGPASVRDAIVNATTKDVVRSPGPGSPNRLLYTPTL